MQTYKCVVSVSLTWSEVLLDSNVLNVLKKKKKKNYPSIVSIHKQQQ